MRSWDLLTTQYLDESAAAAPAVAAVTGEYTVGGKSAVDADKSLAGEAAAVPYDAAYEYVAIELAAAAFEYPAFEYAEYAMRHLLLLLLLFDRNNLHRSCWFQ